MGDSASVMWDLLYRVTGPPPGKDADRAEQLRWVRRYNVRVMTPLAIVVLILFILFLPWWAVVIVAAAQAFTLVSISLKIRQEERRRA